MSNAFVTYAPRVYKSGYTRYRYTRYAFFDIVYALCYIKPHVGKTMYT
jgi:hypothetical protein